MILPAARAEGRFINLGGSLDFTYADIRTTQNNSKDKTTFFQQRYSLHNFGEIFNPRIGTMLINGTFLRQETDTDNKGVDQDFEYTDYSFALNLMPYISPLSLYYQRLNRTNEFDLQNGGDIKDTVTTLGGNWSLSSARLPRISLSYNQSDLDSSDNPNRLPNSINRFFNLESSGRLGETTLTGRYQFNEAEVARSPNSTVNPGGVEKIRGNAFNVTTQSRLAPALVVSTFSRIANRGGGNNSGINFAQERGFGASLFFTPSVKWDTHARIDYSETPGSGNAVDLKRQSLFWSGSYRPSEEVDMVMSTRYFRFDISDVKTSSPFIDYHINYRPFFGFSSGLGASYGQTKTESGGAQVDSDFQRYRGFMNYSRAFEALRYSASYALSYGLSDTNKQGPSQDLMNMISFGVENTQIRIVHVAFNYTYNDINRSNTGPAVQDTGDQSSHRFQLNADSSYFRGILRDDDSLLLQSSASWTEIRGFGPFGSTFLLDNRGTYYFLQGGIFSVGWTHQDNPGGFFLDSDTYHEEVRWSFYPGNTRITMGARANQENTQGNNSLDRDTIELTTAIAYRIGKFLLNVDGRWSDDDSAGLSYKSRSVFVRASRSF